MSIKLYILIFSIVSGCIAGEKEANTMDKISVSVDGFKDGENIPSRYTCDGRDTSPEISWKGIPVKAESIALIMDDPDAPGGTFLHWTLYNIPRNTAKLPEGMPKTQALPDGSLQGITDFGKAGYGGPCPPKAKPHRYYFRNFALDKKLDLKPGASLPELEKAMIGHILAKGEFMGRYGR